MKSYLAPQSVDCGAKFCVVSVSRVPDQGVEAIIILACGFPKIGIKFLGAELWGGKRKAHIFLAGGFALLCLARTDFDALGQDAVIRLGVRCLGCIGDDLNIGADRNCLDRT
jgi:hypothetical protein